MQRREELNRRRLGQGAAESFPEERIPELALDEGHGVALWCLHVCVCTQARVCVCVCVCVCVLGTRIAAEGSAWAKLQKPSRLGTGGSCALLFASDDTSGHYERVL